MKALRALAIRLAGLFAQSRRERELADELESHLALHIADNVRAGMTPQQARRDALVKLGGVESAKEAWRERSTAPLLEHLALDLRFTLRQLRKKPGFTLASVTVLALGMCAATAIFAFVDAVLIKPIPYPNPSTLVAVTESQGNHTRTYFSWLDYQDWNRFNTVFRSLDVYRGDGFLLDAPSGAIPVQASKVSHGFFRTLGVSMRAGRDFSPGDDAPNAARVVILSYGAWQQRLGRSKDVVGRHVALSGEDYTIIGVLPADFHFAPLGAGEFFATVDPLAHCEKSRSCHELKGIARLKDSVSLNAALANLTAIAKRLEERYPNSNRDQGASVIPAADIISGDYRPILMVLMGGAALLLLIACVNVASLVLVRSEARRREVAVRTALGASVARQCSQFFIEALLIVLTSGALSLLLANTAIEGLKALIPAAMAEGMPFLLDLGVTRQVLAFAIVIALLAAVLFAAIPALHLGMSKLRDGLAEGSRGSAGNAWRRLGSRMVVVELATAMVLLAGAALFSQSLYRLLHVDLGFEPARLATLRVAAPDLHYHETKVNIALGEDILRKVRSLPGVESAAIGTILPVSYNGDTDWVRFVGKPYDGKHIEVNDRDVTPGYFRTIGATLVRGRYFREDEDGSKPKVVIVNQNLANRYFPGEDPIGRQMGDILLTPDSLKTIVGVVADIRDGSLDSEIWPAEYHPFAQDPATYFAVLARTSQKPEALLASLPAAIHGVHSDLGVLNETTMQARIDNSTTAYLHRSSAWFVGGFAALALLLGVVGLYGVIAYSVSQRTREIGVRMALGAEHSSVYRLVLKEAGWLVAVGIGAGTVGAVAAAALARKLLFGVSSWDLPTLVGVACILGIAALAASIVPARRAASVNPLDALRTE